MNAHRHAHRGRPGRVRIEITLDAARLQLVIRDHGDFTGPPPVIPLCRPSRADEGLRLYVVAKMMDEVAISRDPYEPGLVVRMVKLLGAVPAEDPSPIASSSAPS